MHSMTVLDTHIDINRIYIYREREKDSLFIHIRYIKCVLCKDTLHVHLSTVHVHTFCSPAIKNMASNML